MRVKKTQKTLRASRATGSNRSKKAAVAAASTHFEWATRSRAAAFAMMFFLVAAALLTAREDAPRADVERAELSPAAITVENDTPRPFEATKINVATASVRTTAPEISAASMAQTVEPEPERVVPVTISGCLEMEEGTLRLTDASGADAPTSRSWKSGFLKRRSAEIELADAVGTLHLRNHVGRRVAATGTLIDRELRARSVRVGRACD